MSRIVILTGSMRRGGNTELLAQAFADGARRNHEVEILSVADYHVNPALAATPVSKEKDTPVFNRTT